MPKMILILSFNEYIHDITETYVFVTFTLEI